MSWLRYDRTYNDLSYCKCWSERVKIYLKLWQTFRAEFRYDDEQSFLLAMVRRQSILRVGALKFAVATTQKKNTHFAIIISHSIKLNYFYKYNVGKSSLQMFLVLY